MLFGGCHDSDKEQTSAEYQIIGHHFPVSSLHSIIKWINRMWDGELNYDNIWQLTLAIWWSDELCQQLFCCESWWHHGASVVCNVKWFNEKIGNHRAAIIMSAIMIIMMMMGSNNWKSESARPRPARRVTHEPTLLAHYHHHYHYYHYNKGQSANIQQSRRGEVCVREKSSDSWTAFIYELWMENNLYYVK